MILFVSEWTEKVAPNTSTSDALIVFLKGALGRVFCSGRIFSKSCLVLMIQSQEWNSSFWQEDRDAHICPNCVFLVFSPTSNSSMKYRWRLPMAISRQAKRKRLVVTSQCCTTGYSGVLFVFLELFVLLISDFTISLNFFLAISDVSLLRIL